MPVDLYKYEGWNITEGKPAHGKINALSEEDARRQLEQQGFIVSTLQNDKIGGVAGKELHLRKPRVKTKDVAWVTRSLATTENAGVPVFDAIGLLARQRAGDPVGILLDDVTKKVAEGSDLADAFAEHEDALGQMTIALIRAGITSGDLGDAMTRAAEIQEQRQRITRKVRGALMYPGVMAGLVGLIFMAILLFVVPSFEQLYNDLDSELPAPTQLLVTLSGALGRISWLLPIMGFLAFRGYKALRAHDKWGYKVDEVLLKAPLFGKLIRISAVARVSATLAGLLSSGVDLMEALRLTEQTAGNRVIAKAFSDARSSVQQGSLLSESIARSPDLPEMFPQLVRLGEQTGKTDEMLERYAKVCAEEVEATVEGLTSMLEPLVIMCIGVVVGGSLMALYMPLLGLANEIQ